MDLNKEMNNNKTLKYEKESIGFWVESIQREKCSSRIKSRDYDSELKQHYYYTFLYANFSKSKFTKR